MGWFLRFFLTVVLIALFGFLGYLYINSQSVVVPDTPTIEMENIELNSLIREKKEVLKQSLEQKKLILEYQGKLLEEKKALLANRRQDIEEYIMQEIGKIKDRYQEQVDNYQAKLDLEYQELVERKEQEYLEQILVKKELYEGKLHELIKNIEDTSFAELEKYRQDIIKEYYLAKINYDLKLKFLDLSSEEKEIYLKELNELETLHMSSIREKESDLIKEIENRIVELEEQYNNELDKFIGELRDKIEGELGEERIKYDRMLQDYLVKQQALMEDEVEKKTREIRESSSDEIATLESLIKDISQEYFRLESEVSILEKEVMY